MDANQLNTKIGGYGGTVIAVAEGSESAAEETLMLWCTQQPTYSQHNAFVCQSSLSLHLDTCGHSLSILQSPSSLVSCLSSLCCSYASEANVYYSKKNNSKLKLLQGTPGVTGAVMWDSGVVLGKFLEHAVDSGRLLLQGKKVVELGSGCGLVG